MEVFSIGRATVYRVAECAGNERLLGTPKSSTLKGERGRGGWRGEHQEPSHRVEGYGLFERMC